MKFIDVYRKLEQENTKYLVLIRTGIFFIGIGKTAKILTKTVGLRPICIQEQVCKVAIPTKSIEKYISKFVSQEIAFVLYDYSKEGFEEDNYSNYKLIFRFSGNYVEEKEEQTDCSKCWYYDKRMTKDVENISEILKDKVKELNGK